MIVIRTKNRLNANTILQLTCLISSIDSGTKNSSGVHENVFAQFVNK